MRIKSSFEEDFKKRSNAWLWRNVSHRATTDDTKETHWNSCLSSTLIFVPSRAKTNLIESLVYQFSYKLLSINSHTNSCLSTLLYCFVTSKVYHHEQSWATTDDTRETHTKLLMSLNSHTNSCPAINSRLCFITNKVSRNNCQSLSYKLLSINSYRSENSLVSRNNPCSAQLSCQSQQLMSCTTLVWVETHDVLSIDGCARELKRSRYRVKCSHMGPTYM